MDSSRIFRPGFSFSWQAIRKHLDFSRKHLGERLITHVVYQLDTLLIGKWLGKEALGIYDVFKRLLLRPVLLLVQTIEKVSFPIFSKIQEDLEHLRGLYLRLLQTICALVFPLYLLIIFWAPSIILVYYGQSRIEYLSIFQWLAAYAALSAITNPIDTLLLAKGRIQSWFYAQLLMVPFLVLCFYLGSLSGLLGTIQYLIALRVLFIIASYIFILQKELHSPWSEYFRSILLPFGLVLLAAAGSLFLGCFTSEFHLTWTIMLTALFLLLYILLNQNSINPSSQTSIN